MYLKICHEKKKKEKQAHIKWKNPTKEHPMQMTKDGQSAKWGWGRRILMFTEGYSGVFSEK